MARRKKPQVTSADILALVEQSLDDDQAVDTVVVDLIGKTSIADSMVIASGRSSRQVGSMAQKIVEKLKEIGIRRVRTEGMPQCDWVLVDAGDVIVHLFRPEIRSFYNLEKMWGPSLPEGEVDALPETSPFVETEAEPELVADVH